MFDHKSNAQINADMIEALYDFVLDPDIKDRERKIGLLAKKDIENGRYNVAVLNQTLVSLQREAVKFRLSPDAQQLYETFKTMLTKNVPFGTNLSSMYMMSSYLDW